MRQYLSIVGYGTLATVLYSAPAYAYLDPGTGSIILQLLLGGVAGGIVIVKLYWARLKSFFVRKPSIQEQSNRAEGD